VQIAYYDQQREQLVQADRITVGEGRDTVTVNGQPRHGSFWVPCFRRESTVAGEIAVGWRT
jgi:hypothetical protein